MADIRIPVKVVIKGRITEITPAWGDVLGVRIGDGKRYYIADPTTGEFNPTRYDEMIPLFDGCCLVKSEHSGDMRLIDPFGEAEWIHDQSEYDAYKAKRYNGEPGKLKVDRLDDAVLGWRIVNRKGLNAGSSVYYHDIEENFGFACVAVESSGARWILDLRADSLERPGTKVVSRKSPAPSSKPRSVQPPSPSSKPRSVQPPSPSSKPRSVQPPTPSPAPPAPPKPKQKIQSLEAFAGELFERIAVQSEPDADWEALKGYQQGEWLHTSRCGEWAIKVLGGYARKLGANLRRVKKGYYTLESTGKKGNDGKPVCYLKVAERKGKGVDLCAFYRGDCEAADLGFRADVHDNVPPPALPEFEKFGGKPVSNEQLQISSRTHMVYRFESMEQMSDALSRFAQELEKQLSSVNIYRDGYFVYRDEKHDWYNELEIEGEEGGYAVALYCDIENNIAEVHFSDAYDW